FLFAPTVAKSRRARALRRQGDMLAPSRVGPRSLKTATHASAFAPLSARLGKHMGSRARARYRHPTARDVADVASGEPARASHTDRRRHGLVLAARRGDFSYDQEDA